MAVCLAGAFPRLVIAGASAVWPAAVKTAATAVESAVAYFHHDRRPRARPEPSSESREDVLQAQHCQWYLDRMEQIQARLRAGYREPYGNALRQERREISTKYFRECR